ncbi:unnamed protein product [Blepharisma stoltei]|uniref:Uncharacterized protein n=1 Tax=Blepharisma stoltei TaxID=1481888 RepID=A0AAU9K8L5_9CILI|nr:unnamed protein product [Blepharisma stoltei]
MKGESKKNFKGLFSPIEIISTNHLLRTEHNECKVRMTRIYYSQWFKYIYVILAVLAAFCIVYTSINWAEQEIDGWFIGIQASLLVLVVLEILYRVLMLGSTLFFQEKVNIIDSFLSFTSWIIALVSSSLHDKVGYSLQIISMTILSLRYLVTYIRVIKYVKSTKNTEISIIDLNDVSEVEENQPNTEMRVKRAMLPNTNQQEASQTFGNGIKFMPVSSNKSEMSIEEQ